MTPMRPPAEQGYVELPAMIAAACWAIIVVLIVAVMHLGAARAEIFPDITVTPDLTGRSVITWRDIEDRRPFLLRLIESIRPWGEAGARRAKVRVQHDRADLAGYHYDDERVSSRQYVPDQFAIGLQGGADF